MNPRSPAPAAHPAAARTIALLLFSSGWGANHFASMIPVLQADLGVPSLLVTGAFGIYALGLMPALLGGGAIADRIGPRHIVVTGAAITALGNLLMMLWHVDAGLLVGRLIVGVGVGLAMSSGTSWAVSLLGARGAALAGVVLTLGFAAGPVGSGLIGLAPWPEVRDMAPFAVAALLAGVAAAGGARTRVSPPTAARTGDHEAAPRTPATPADTGQARGLARAYMAALPTATWVFAIAITGVVVVPSYVDVPAPLPALLPGIAGVFVYGSALVAQTIGRRLRPGPVPGVVAAVAAALGFGLLSMSGPSWSIGPYTVVLVVAGIGYGIGLQTGLSDIERFAPVANRGTVIGLFYVVAYLGFGVPAAIDALEPMLGRSPLLLALAGIAAVTVVWRVALIAGRRFEG